MTSQIIEKKCHFLPLLCAVIRMQWIQCCWPMHRRLRRNFAMPDTFRIQWADSVCGDTLWANLVENGSHRHYFQRPIHNVLVHKALVPIDCWCASNKDHRNASKTEPTSHICSLLLARLGDLVECGIMEAHNHCSSVHCLMIASRREEDMGRSHVVRWTKRRRRRRLSISWNTPFVARCRCCCCWHPIFIFVIVYVRAENGAWRRFNGKHKAQPQECGRTFSSKPNGAS